MSIDDLARDDEYVGLFTELVQKLAEETRVEHEELLAHGFATVEVIGSPTILYRRNGRTYTRETALAFAHAVNDPEEDCQ